jgi:hypothetical protein
MELPSVLAIAAPVEEEGSAIAGSRRDGLVAARSLDIPARRLDFFF